MNDFQMKKQLTNQKTMVTNWTTPTAQKVGEMVSLMEMKISKTQIAIQMNQI